MEVTLGFIDSEAFSRRLPTRISHIDTSLFYQSKGVDQLIEEVESMYIAKLEHGNRTKAMQRLRVPPLEEKQPRIVTFRLGVYIGERLSTKKETEAMSCYL